MLFPKFSKYCSQILKLGAKLLHFCELCKFLWYFLEKKFFRAEEITWFLYTSSKPLVYRGVSLSITGS